MSQKRGHYTAMSTDEEQNGLVGPVGRDEAANAGKPLRSACDACQKSKIKCFGGYPCLTCELSQTRCNYSPRSRLGRPRGSKNKRTLMQESLNMAEQRPALAPGEMERNSAHHQQQRQQQRQKQKQQQQRDGLHPPRLNQLSHELGLDAELESGVMFQGCVSPVEDGNIDLMIDPSLDLVDAMSIEDCHSGIEHFTFTSQTASDAMSLGYPSGIFRPLSVEIMPEVLTHDPKYVTDVADASPSNSESMALPPLSSFSANFTSDGLESAGKGFGASSSPPASLHLATSVASPNGQAGCSCLQGLVQLLYHLENLRYSPTHNNTGLSVDSVLSGLQVAEKPWKDLMQCAFSFQNIESHKESFLLFGLSLRIFLSSFQKLNSIKDTPSVDAHDQHNNKSPISPSVSSDIPVLVGSFELTGEAKAEVIDVTIRRALLTVTPALVHLCDRTACGTGRPLKQPLLASTVADVSHGCSKSHDKNAHSYNSAANHSGAPNLKILEQNAQRTDSDGIATLLNTLQHSMRALEEEN